MNFIFKETKRKKLIKLKEPPVSKQVYLYDFSFKHCYF